MVRLEALSQGTFIGLAGNTSSGSVLFDLAWFVQLSQSKGRLIRGTVRFWATTVTYLCLCDDVDADPRDRGGTVP